MGARNQVCIGLSYRPASLCSLAAQFQTLFLESISLPIAGLKFPATMCLRVLDVLWSLSRKNVLVNYRGEIFLFLSGKTKTWGELWWWIHVVLICRHWNIVTKLNTKLNRHYYGLWRLCVLLDVLCSLSHNYIHITWLTTRVLFPYLQKKVAVFTKSAVSVLWGPPCGQTKNRKNIMRGTLICQKNIIN